MPILMTPEDVANAAAHRVGLEPIESFAEETLGAQAAATAYAGTLSFMLGVYPFSWARKTARLALLDEESLLGFRFVYALPEEALGPPMRCQGHRVFRPITELVVEGAQIHANAENVIATYMTLPEPARWSGPFREAVTLAIAAELALAITSDRGLWGEMRERAFGPASMFPRGGAMGAAIAADAFATPALRLEMSGGFLAGR